MTTTHAIYNLTPRTLAIRVRNGSVIEIFPDPYRKAQCKMVQCGEATECPVNSMFEVRHTCLLSPSAATKEVLFWKFIVCVRNGHEVCARTDQCCEPVAASGMDSSSRRRRNHRFAQHQF